MPLPSRPLGRPRGLLVLGFLLVVGLGASAGFFRWAARDVAEGVLGELAARPSVPTEQVELWLAYGEPQIQNRLAGLRFSPELPALVTHVVRPSDPLGAARVYGIDLVGGRPARVVRQGLIVEVRVGGPRLLREGPLRGEGAERIPRVTSGAGAQAGRAFAQGVLDWALEPLMSALPRDIEGAELRVLIEDEPFAPAATGPSAPGEAPQRRGPGPALGASAAGLLGLALALVLAAGRGRRDARRGAACEPGERGAAGGP